MFIDNIGRNFQKTFFFYNFQLPVSFNFNIKVGLTLLHKKLRINLILIFLNIFSVTFSLKKLFVSKGGGCDFSSVCCYTSRTARRNAWHCIIYTTCELHHQLMSDGMAQLVEYRFIILRPKGSSPS